MIGDFFVDLHHPKRTDISVETPETTLDNIRKNEYVNVVNEIKSNAQKDILTREALKLDPEREITPSKKVIATFPKSTKEERPYSVKLPLSLADNEELLDKAKSILKNHGINDIENFNCSSLTDTNKTAIKIAISAASTLSPDIKDFIQNNYSKLYTCLYDSGAGKSTEVTETSGNGLITTIKENANDFVKPAIAAVTVGSVSYLVSKKPLVSALLAVASGAGTYFLFKNNK